jgi:predicted ATPase with chaperone activity
LLDRIDLHVEVTPVRIEELTSMSAPERPKLGSEEIRARVLQARAVQAERFKDTSETCIATPKCPGAWYARCVELTTERTDTVENRHGTAATLRPGV